MKQKTKKNVKKKMLCRYTILYCTLPYSTLLYSTILYYTILYYTILYYAILYYTILYYTLLYYTNYINNQNVSDNKRCLHGSKNPHRIGLKWYLINRSSRLLLNFLFCFAKIVLIREEIVVLLKKSAASCFQNFYK